MVSNGKDFRFYLVSKNLYVTGLNDSPANSKNTLENLRPDAFLASMMIRPADLTTEQMVLFDDTDEENATYILMFLRKGANGELVLGRNVWFDRTDLNIVRQMVYDENGVAIVSDTRYGKWTPREGSLFPNHIDINRPKDGYGVVIDVMDVKMNLPLGDEKFVLEQPAGTTLQTIGAAEKK
jgi:hypothetical protein